MSETATATHDVAGFLATVPLFDGVPEDDLKELVRVLRRRDVPAGEVLWRQGEAATGMLVIVTGRVSITVALPGERTVEIAALGPGEALGEIPLLDGGEHSGTVLATERTQLLALSRRDFAGLISRRHPTAFALRRCIAGVGCARLRRHVGTLAASLGGEVEAPASAGELDFCAPPDSRYVRRLGGYWGFDSLALWHLLTAGRFVRCPAGVTLVAEGTPASACYLALNGAVEKVVVRGGRRIRVGLAGPGQAFGYEGLIDGAPAPMTATARERALLLRLPHEAFARLFDGQESHAFLDMVLTDLMATLRQALRPHARLASSL